MADAFSVTLLIGRVIASGLAAAVTAGAWFVGGGGGGAVGLTTTVTSADEASAPSSAVNRTTNVPAWLNTAVVLNTASLANATPRGPLTRVHLYVSTFEGLASSVAVAVSATSLSGSVIVSGVADAVTTGARFSAVGSGFTVTTTVSVLVARESLADNCRV